jgi:hypothetical protein
METEGSLPCSQEAATDSYPEPDESSPHPTSFFIWDTHFPLLRKFQKSVQGPV